MCVHKRTSHRKFFSRNSFRKCENQNERISRNLLVSFYKEIKMTNFTEKCKIFTWFAEFNFREERL